MEILGFAISGVVALTLLLLGAFGLFAKGSLGQSVRSFFGMIPIGNPKLWSIILLAVGLIAGGATYGWAQVSALTGGATASAFTTTETSSTMPLTLKNCQFTQITATTAAVNGNVTLRKDPYDTTHYYVDLNNVTNAGGGSFNGTILCDREGDIDKSASVSCYFKSGKYTNKASSTDTSNYYMVSLASGASLVDGIPSGFRQTAYLNDGSIATTSSAQEKTTWTFTGGSSAQASDTLGFYFTLPGATNVNYLNAQDSVNNEIYCGSQRVAYFTVTKIAP